MTVVSSVAVRQAQPDSLVQALDIYNQAARNLQENGIKQWPYPVPDAFRQHLQNELRYGEVYLAWTTPDPDPVGVVYLKWSEQALWPHDTWGALYLYGLAVHPRARGRGVGAELLAWASNYAKQQGRACVRLDCLAANMKLRRYYRDQGFRLHGLATAGAVNLALYEKRL